MGLHPEWNIKEKMEGRLGCCSLILDAFCQAQFLLCDSPVICHPVLELTIDLIFYELWTKIRLFPPLTLSIYSEEMKLVTYKDIHTSIFISDLFKIVKIWSYSMYIVMNKNITHKQWDIIQPRERKKSCHKRKKESGGQNTKWDKTGIQRQTLYDIICMWKLKKCNSKCESRMVVDGEQRQWR